MLLWTSLIRLYRLDVLSTRTFFALPSRVGNFLAFMQGLETDALEGRCVEEEVFAGLGLDEAEILVRQFLDAAFWHFAFSRID